MMLTISGAYGRDYSSKKAILADWNTGRDFTIRSYGPDMGRYINRGDALTAGITDVMVRYRADRNVCRIEAKADDTGWK